MVRIMATENREQYDDNQTILIETVQTVRDYLNTELCRYKKISEIPQGLINSLDLDNKSTFENIKTKGVGQTTILKFLGKGWKQWKIQHALEVIMAP